MYSLFMVEKGRKRRSPEKQPDDGTLADTFRDYAASLARKAPAHPTKGVPFTNPTAFLHRLDCNLHTLAHDSVVTDTVQHFSIDEGDRWQYVSNDRRSCFICDRDARERIVFQSFDMETHDKTLRTFSGAAEAVAFFRGAPATAAAPDPADQEKAARIGAEVWTRLDDAKSHRAVTKAAAELAGLGAGWAIVELYGIHATPTRYSKRRQEALSLLEGLARGRNLTVEELFDASVPSTLPAGAEKRFAAIAGRRFERCMVDGVRFPFADACSRFFQHAPTAAIASLLVWGTTSVDGTVRAWRWAEQGPHDADGHDVTVADDGEVGVLHPLELGPSAVECWRRVLAAHKVAQPFLQIERPLYTLTTSQKAANVITDFKRYDRQWLMERDWWGFKKDSDYMSDVDTFAVVMARDDQSIEAPLDGVGRLAAIVMGKAKEQSSYQYVATSKATFGSLHPVSQSELLYALLGPGRNAATAAARDAVPPRSPTTGRQPGVEPAKSGRSTCITCGEKIEKDALRVAIEREIDTPQFKGLGNVYVHAKQSCIAGCPELEGFRLG